MQRKYVDGSFDAPEPYDEAKMNKLIEDPDTEHVEVFQKTKHTLQKRSQFSRPPKVKKMRMKGKEARKQRKRNQR